MTAAQAHGERWPCMALRTSASPPLPAALDTVPSQHIARPGPAAVPGGGAPAPRPAWPTPPRAAGRPGPSWRRSAGTRRKRAAAPPVPEPSRWTRRGGRRGAPRRTNPSRTPARRARTAGGQAGCPAGCGGRLLAGQIAPGGTALQRQTGFTYEASPTTLAPRPQSCPCIISTGLGRRRWRPQTEVAAPDSLPTPARPKHTPHPPRAPISEPETLTRTRGAMSSLNRDMSWLSRVRASVSSQASAPSRTSACSTSGMKGRETGPSVSTMRCRKESRRARSPRWPGSRRGTWMAHCRAPVRVSNPKGRKGRCLEWLGVNGAVERRAEGIAGSGGGEFLCKLCTATP